MPVATVRIVGIEDNVLRRHADFFREDAVGARADLYLAFGGIGLALFVERHHDDAAP